MVAIFLSESVHFWNTVWRSSVLSKLWSFSTWHQLKSKQNQLMYYWKSPQFWKNWRSRNCVLRMNGLYPISLNRIRRNKVNWDHNSQHEKTRFWAFINTDYEFGKRGKLFNEIRFLTFKSHSEDLGLKCHCEIHYYLLWSCLFF